MSYSVRRNMSPFFTAGRQGNPINKILIHHAATTNFDGIGATFKTRGVSAHYGVGRNKNVDKYVEEGSIAYHAGNWAANCTSIGIENVNKTGAPDWLVDDATFNTLVELVRDIAERHNLLPLKVGKNLFGHKDFSATACPMQLYGRLNQLVDKVNKGSSSPNPSTGKKSLATIAKEVIAGKWGNGVDRQRNLERAGYSYSKVQAEVNKQLGGGSKPVAPKKKSITTIAKEVLAGAWGNSDARVARLKKAGYNYKDVQAAVNKMLGVGKTVPSGGVFAVGQTVVVTNPVDINGTRIAVSGKYRVMEVRGSRIVIGKGGVVTAAMKNTSLRKA